MFKKLIIASAVLAISSSAALASSGPYVGFSAGAINNNYKFSNSTETSNTPSSLGALANIFAGYGATLTQTIYLGGEVFANMGTGEAHDLTIVTDSTTLKVKNKYSYGVSIIPGLMVSDQTMIFARMGVVKTHFNTKQTSTTTTATNETSAMGGQLGLGVETALNQNLSVRAEYDYTSYRAFTALNTRIKPNSNQLLVGLVYKFD